jgi:hypothetical protein
MLTPSQQTDSLHVGKPRRSPANPYQPFTRVATSGRIIREYSGVLPCARLSARHILRCEHLRDIPGEGLPPYRVEPDFTHQIWLWYRSSDEANRLRLVFRGQFDCSIPGREADVVACEVTDYLAELLWDLSNMEESMHHENCEIFWSKAIEAKVRTLLNGEAGSVIERYS